MLSGEAGRTFQCYNGRVIRVQGFYDLANKPLTRIESNKNRACSLPAESVDFAADETGKTRLILLFTR